MRRSARVAIAIPLLVLWLSTSAQPVAACTGEEASLAAGIRHATSIFYARIVTYKLSPALFYDLQLEVGKVIRGSGQTHVDHLITPHACDPLSVGQDGIVVLGSVNPFGDGPHDVYNFFYVLGPGHTNAAAARALLGELPSTDAAPVARPADRGSNLDAALLVLLIAGAAVGIQVLGSHRRR